jgi:LuxR family maltose regulon positive regulatory protein
MFTNNERNRAIAQPLTKLIKPGMPASYLRRPRLRKRYQDAIKNRILLVTAPAGYGKTTFLSEVLQDIKQPVAWVSLDKRDDYSFNFWNNIIMAIRSIEPSFGQRAVIQLQKNEESYEIILTELINEILEDVPDLYIVLDDYHCIETQEIHHAIDFLMNYLPAQAHLIISSRTYPPLSLNRLRGQGHIAEINANDLKFTIEETAEFLNDVMGFSLDEGMINYVFARIEGWIAGLQMIVVTMQGNMDFNSLLASLRGSNKDILEYLTYEVLEQQEEHIRRFLLETSILEHFNGEMCDYILERNDSQQILETLLAKNSFLQPIDNDGKWFRFHSLFKSALYKKLANDWADIVPILHLRASQWFEHEGLIEEAIEHALEAEEYDRAMTLFDKIASNFMGQDKFNRFMTWFDKIPEEFITKSLWYTIGCAVAFEMNRQPEHQKLFTQAVVSISETKAINEYPKHIYYAYLYILQTLEAYHKGNIITAIECADKGLEAMPADEARGRCGLLCVKGFSLWMKGELMEAYQCCREAAYLGKVVGWTYSVGLNLSAVAHIQFAMGHLTSAVETCYEIQSGSSLNGTEVSSSSYANLLLGRILYQRNLLDAAEEQVFKAVYLSENGQEPVLWLCSQMALARINIVRDKKDIAMEIARSAKITYENIYPGSVLADIFITRLWIMLGDGSAAADSCQSWMGSFLSSDSNVSKEENIKDLLQWGIYGNDIRNVWAELPLLTYIRLKLLQENLDGLFELLEKIQQVVEAKHWQNILIETLILKAMVVDAAGDTNTALKLLTEAMVLSLKERQLRLFADEGQPMLQLLRRTKQKGNVSDYVAKIISLFNIPETATAQNEGRPEQLPEPLTRREKEILELVCDGATNKEIAERLFLSISTVKNHIHNIYGKIGVGNRAQAIIRVQEIGLLRSQA